MARLLRLEMMAARRIAQDTSTSATGKISHGQATRTYTCSIRTSPVVLRCGAVKVLRRVSVILFERSSIRAGGSSVNHRASAISDEKLFRANVSAGAEDASDTVMPVTFAVKMSRRKALKAILAVTSTKKAGALGSDW